MRVPIIAILVFLVATSLPAQSPVNVRGRVVDSDDGSPVADAWVHLTALGMSDSSKADGSFLINNAAALSVLRLDQGYNFSCSGKTIRLTLSRAERIAIRSIDLEGRSVWLISSRIFGPGTCVFRLPSERRSSGVRMIRAQIGGRTESWKLLNLDNSVSPSFGGSLFPGHALVKAAAAADTLQVVRRGYVPKKIAVGTYTDSVGVMLVWRAFADTSAWNALIPSNAQIDDSSASYIQDLSASSQWNFLGINIKGYSVPVYYCDSASVPKYQVVCTDVTGLWFDRLVPIPNGATPDSLSDHHICIIDKKLGREWGMWNAVRQANNTWQCGVGAAADLCGSGVRPPAPLATPWQLAHGARASGFPLIAGLIRVGDIKGGRIDHALALAYPHCRSRYFIPPASTAQGTTTDALPTRGIPMGSRIQLDPSINVDTLNISVTGKIIARALQEYGAYICDYSGAINLYADGSKAACAYWDTGVLQTYEINQVFNAAMLRRFRLIKMSAFYDNNN